MGLVAAIYAALDSARFWAEAAALSNPELGFVEGLVDGDVETVVPGRVLGFVEGADELGFVEDPKPLDVLGLVEGAVLGLVEEPNPLGRVEGVLGLELGLDENPLLLLGRVEGVLGLELGLDENPLLLGLVDGFEELEGRDMPELELGREDGLELPLELGREEGLAPTSPMPMSKKLSKATVNSLNPDFMCPSF